LRVVDDGSSRYPRDAGSGLLVHLILVLEEEPLDGPPVVCDVGLAIQLSICEFARVIFVFVIAPKYSSILGTKANSSLEH
jgi:hypothetical protein